MMRRLLAVLFFLTWAVAAGGQEFLDPKIAFKPTARAVDAKTLEVTYDIARGYYLYRDKFRFAADGVQLGAAQFPPGKEKQDDNFGKVQVYTEQVAIRLPLAETTPEGGNVALRLTSQGCADSGLCYPPQTQLVNVVVPKAAGPGGMGSADAAVEGAAGGDESGRIAQALRHAGFWANLAFFFVAGLGLALTPCVFPMIPILSGIIAGQGHRGTRARGLALATAYVLGMATTYAVAGVAAGLTGTLISGLLQNAWVLGAFALIFVALAFSMFGFYQLQLPTALQSRLSEEAGHFSGGRGPAVFAMGALSGLIVGPCVAAPLAGALLYIGQTGDALLGGAALFVLALGMGVPLIAVGVSAGTLLPRAGPWMDAVKNAFGVILLGVALWLVSPLLPTPAALAAWSVLLIIPAIYLHALDPLPPHARGWQRFWKGVGILMLLCGAALLVGALSGAKDPLQPLSGLRGVTQTAAPAEAAFERVTSVQELDQRLKAAGRPVMLDFYADWCSDCKTMDRTTFSDPAVRERLRDLLLLRADVTAVSETDKQLMSRFGLYGPPAIIFFDPQGSEIKGSRIVGYQDAATFSRSLAAILAR